MFVNTNFSRGASLHTIQALGKNGLPIFLIGKIEFSSFFFVLFTFSYLILLEVTLPVGSCDLRGNSGSWLLVGMADRC